MGYPKPGGKNQGQMKANFASCLRIVDPVTFETVYLEEFENKETVFSLFVSSTVGLPGQVYLFLGIGEEATLQRKCSMAYINTYIFSQDGTRIQLLHKTPCELIPSAFNEMRGRLISGVGNILRVYEMGQKKLLRKFDNRNFKSNIVQIRCEENRIYVADTSESIHVLKFKPEHGQLYIFADDVLNRWVTNFCMLDEDTVAGLDKFENFFVNRLPIGCEDVAEDDPTSTKFNFENGYLNGAAFKLDKVNQFFIGEVGTSIQKCKLSLSSSELIIFGTTMGSICALMPLETR